MRLPPAHVAVPAELIERLPSLKGPRNEKSFATMWAAGWTGAHWVYLLVLLSTLIGCIFADVRDESGENENLEVRDAFTSPGVGVGAPVDDGEVCRVGHWRAIQEEVFGLGV
ncbi:hypothetical protein PHISCL_09353, partial [Aspergillus sclerotialis]